MATVRLTDLLPTNGYLLPYALSLFFSSLALNFAGAFLTLDRTRSFVPAADVLQDRQKSVPRLIGSFFRGGIGGILTGYVFGVHFTTFLSVLIPSVTSSEPLKPVPFASVWLLSSLAISTAAGRWKYFAFIASGFCGGATLALAISVTIHPSLLTRIALVTVFASTLAILTPLPIARSQKVLLRTSSSAAGSFGLILSIALFSNIEPWYNVWERLWVRSDIQWGSSQEKGLSAGFFLFFASGFCVDWWLRSKFGENPDQKWDSYLAQYVANLPAEPDRAGVFHPFSSIWSKAPPRYPGIEPVAPSEVSQDSHQVKRDKWVDDGRFLKTKTRESIKFRPLDDKDSTDSEIEAPCVSKGDARHATPYPWLIGADSTHSSTSTVLGDVLHPRVAYERDPNKVDPQTRLSPDLEVLDLPNYTDHEMDIAPSTKPAGYGSNPNWTPRFLRHKAQHHKPQTNDPRTTHPSDYSILGTDRHVPQQENRSDPLNKLENPRWQAFWRDVNEKIQHKEIS